MNIEDIRKLKRAIPFVPFDLVKTEGRVVTIDRALAIALAPSGRSVAGYAPRGHSFFFPLTELSELRIKANKRGSRRPRKNGS